MNIFETKVNVVVVISKICKFFRFVIIYAVERNNDAMLFP